MMPRSLLLLAPLCLTPWIGWCESGYPSHYTICIDYHCDMQQTIHLDTADWEGIAALFQKPMSAEQEKQIISQSIAQFERLTGQQSETWRDLEKNQGEGSEIGQLDCIAESKNTTTYLTLLEQQGLLNWHKVSERVKRHFLHINTHWTAVMVEKDTGVSYAVDSWYGKHAEPPIIQPLEEWKQKRMPQ